MLATLRSPPARRSISKTSRHSIWPSTKRFSNFLLNMGCVGAV